MRGRERETKFIMLLARLLDGCLLQEDRECDRECDLAPEPKLLSIEGSVDLVDFKLAGFASFYDDFFNEWEPGAQMKRFAGHGDPEFRGLRQELDRIAQNARERLESMRTWHKGRGEQALFEELVAAAARVRSHQDRIRELERISDVWEVTFHTILVCLSAMRLPASVDDPLAALSDELRRVREIVDQNSEEMIKRHGAGLQRSIDKHAQGKLNEAIEHSFVVIDCASWRRARRKKERQEKTPPSIFSCFSHRKI